MLQQTILLYTCYNNRTVLKQHSICATETVYTHTHSNRTVQLQTVATPAVLYGTAVSCIRMYFAGHIHLYCLVYKVSVCKSPAFTE